MLSGLLQLTLAVVLAVITPGPTNAAPLALRVNVPLDIWKPASVQQRPTLPPNPQIEQTYVHGQTNNNMPPWKSQGVTRVEGAAALPNNGGGDDGDDDNTAKLNFRGMTLPKDFRSYDLDHNRGVSLAELAKVTDTEKANAQEPFDAADIDGNLALSPEEFTHAPWIFDARGITVIEAGGKHGEEDEEEGGETRPDVQV